MRRSFFIPVLIFVFLAAACKKDDFDYPYVPIHLDLGIYSDLGQLGPGGYIFKDGYGIRGLLIYMDYDENYYVFDRACTYEKDFSCKLTSSASSLAVKCPCCNSQFLLGESSDPIKGPASHPLIRYNAFVDGSFLKIVN